MRKNIIATAILIAVLVVSRLRALGDTATLTVSKNVNSDGFSKYEI